MERYLGDEVADERTQGVELVALSRITELIGTAVDLDSTLTSILGVLNDTMKMERATLLLFDRVMQKLTIKASCGLSECLRLVRERSAEAPGDHR